MLGRRDVMIEANYKMGEQFDVQFVWRLSDGDYLRAIFKAEVVGFNPPMMRYVVRLAAFVAGRQENHAGEMRPREEMSATYWQLVQELVGRQVDLAYEADDGQPIQLRLPTLTRQHAFFTRYDEGEGE